MLRIDKFFDSKVNVSTYKNIWNKLTPTISAIDRNKRVFTFWKKCDDRNFEPKLTD